jgi:hypothetical protein
MPRFIRVKDRRTGYQYDVLETQFNAELHTKADQRRWPPTTRPRRPKYSVNHTPEVHDPSASDQGEQS